MKKAAVLSLATVFAAASFTGTAFAAHEGQAFTAELTPDQEVPAAESEATGDAQIQVSEDGNSLEFTVNAYDLDNTLAGHLHSGAVGENGPVELFLFENEEAMDYDGEVATGTLTADDLVGDLSWQEFSMALVAGDIYVNLHTEEYPDGEIRGQAEMTDEYTEGDEMADTASNGPLYTMLGMLAVVAGGIMMYGRRNKITE